MNKKAKLIRPTGIVQEISLNLSTVEVSNDLRINPDNFEIELNERYNSHVSGLVARFRTRFLGRKIEVSHREIHPFDVLEHLESRGFPRWLKFILPKSIRENPVVRIHAELKTEYHLTAPEIEFCERNKTFLVQTMPESISFHYQPEEDETEEPAE